MSWCLSPEEGNVQELLRGGGASRRKPAFHSFSRCLMLGQNGNRRLSKATACQEFISCKQEAIVTLTAAQLFG